MNFLKHPEPSRNRSGKPLFPKSLFPKSSHPAKAQRQHGRTLPRPSVAEFEAALVTLVDTLFDYRRRQPVDDKPVQLLKCYSLGELVNTPSETLVAIDLVEDPVDHALKHHIKKVGKYLAPVLTFDELQQLVERVSDLQPADASCRLAVLDKCFDGLKTHDGGWWVS